MDYYRKATKGYYQAPQQHFTESHKCVLCNGPAWKFSNELGRLIFERFGFCQRCQEKQYPSEEQQRKLYYG